MQDLFTFTNNNYSYDSIDGIINFCFQFTYSGFDTIKCEVSLPKRTPGNLHTTDNNCEIKYLEIYSTEKIEGKSEKILANYFGIKDSIPTTNIPITDTTTQFQLAQFTRPSTTMTPALKDAKITPSIANPAKVAPSEAFFTQTTSSTENAVRTTAAPEISIDLINQADVSAVTTVRTEAPAIQTTVSLDYFKISNSTQAADVNPSTSSQTEAGTKKYVTEAANSRILSLNQKDVDVISTTVMPTTENTTKGVQDLTSTTATPTLQSTPTPSNFTLNDTQLHPGQVRNTSKIMTDQSNHNNTQTDASFSKSFGVTTQPPLLEAVTDLDSFSTTKESPSKPETSTFFLHPEQTSVPQASTQNFNTTDISTSQTSIAHPSNASANPLILQPNVTAEMKSKNKVTFPDDQQAERTIFSTTQMTESNNHVADITSITQRPKSVTSNTTGYIIPQNASTVHKIQKTTTIEPVTKLNGSISNELNGLSGKNQPTEPAVIIIQSNTTSDISFREDQDLQSTIRPVKLPPSTSTPQSDRSTVAKSINEKNYTLESTELILNNFEASRTQKEPSTVTQKINLTSSKASATERPIKTLTDFYLKKSTKLPIVTTQRSAFVKSATYEQNETEPSPTVLEKSQGSLSSTEKNLSVLTAFPPEIKPSQFPNTILKSKTHLTTEEPQTLKFTTSNVKKHDNPIFSLSDKSTAKQSGNLSTTQIIPFRNINQSTVTSELLKNDVFNRKKVKDTKKAPNELSNMTNSPDVISNVRPITLTPSRKQIYTQHPKLAGGHLSISKNNNQNIIILCLGVSIGLGMFILMIAVYYRYKRYRKELKEVKSNSFINL